MAETHKLTIDQVKEALQQEAGLKTFAARRLNCSWKTVDQYIKDNPELQDALEEINQQILDMAESVILKRVQKGDPAILRWFAERKMRKRGYGKTDEEEKAAWVPPTVIIQPVAPPKRPKDPVCLSSKTQVH